MCEVTQAAPIHIAIESAHVECIQELLVCGARLDLADRSGDNVFHYAAKCSDPNIIQVGTESLSHGHFNKGHFLTFLEKFTLCVLQSAHLQHKNY